jgi:hypothetical protein
MAEGKHKILYLEDDDGAWDSFLMEGSNDKRFHFDRAVVAEECINGLYNGKWDGFIFDAMGKLRASDEGTSLDGLVNVMTVYNNLDKKPPYAIYTAIMSDDSKKALVEDRLRTLINRDMVFYKNRDGDRSEMLEKLNTALVSKNEFQFKDKYPDIYKVLASEDFLDKKDSFINNYLNINKKEVLRGQTIANEIAGIRNILERVLNVTSEIYSTEFGEDDMKLKHDMFEKISWLKPIKREFDGRRTKTEREIYTPEYIHASMNSINAICRVAGSHDKSIKELPSKRTLDGLLFQMADVLNWYHECIMKKFGED